MKSLVFIVIGALSISGCAVIDPGAIDEGGVNGIERAVQEMVGFTPLDDGKVKGPDLPELTKNSEVATNAIVAEPAVPSVFSAKAMASVPEKPKELTASEYLAQVKLSDDLVSESYNHPFEEVSLVERFPEAKPPQEALKKYMELKDEGDEEKPLVPIRKFQRYADADKVAFKEKFPGVIIFLAADAIFQTSSLPKLQELAARLNSNVSESVLFQAQLAEGEKIELADQRFKLVRDHLAKEFNIQPERLVLDQRRAVGDWPEFKMFILKLGLGSENLSAAGK